ncbi:hypothetical protein FHT40_004361 [Mycolicibacterium sp. BK556]|nr:hypothetical protein [Mycolicibacterium sp. BK556]MBB3634604.1 hypothetical protein [Mycolicibacterium sp. BK607]
MCCIDSVARARPAVANLTHVHLFNQTDVVTQRRFLASSASIAL